MKSVRRALRRFRFHREVAKLAGPKVLRELAEVWPDLVFVQVGANDGKMMDPIRSTILRTRWRGLVVEPVPELFAALKLNYQHARDRVQAVNAAVSSAGGDAEFYHLRDRSGLPPLPPWAAGLGSFHRDVILAHRDRLEQIEKYLTIINVRCMTLTSLCESHGLNGMDLLVIDTEGYDFEIIKQLDFQRYRPFVLIFEHHHFDEETERACTDRLKRNGYSLFREGLDTWALDVGREDVRYERLLEKVGGWVVNSRYASYVSD